MLFLVVDYMDTEGGEEPRNVFRNQDLSQTEVASNTISKCVKISNCMMINTVEENHPIYIKIPTKSLVLRHQRDIWPIISMI